MRVINFVFEILFLGVFIFFVKRGYEFFLLGGYDNVRSGFWGCLKEY